MSLPPIRRQVVVPAAADRAFEVFTEQIASWWPVAQHSVYGEKASAAFAGGRLVETGPDGEEALWGTVLEWEPPRLLRMTWHPGYAEERASEVEVSFAPVSAAITLVTLTHSGWERFPDPAAARDAYRDGWPLVLGSYAATIPAAPASGEPVWLVLTHTPAPGVARPADHPDFPGHAAFLAGLKERGVLVAAGPFPASGEGMTVVRVPAGEAGALLVAANEDDTSVAKGVLEVRVRPWLVMLTGPSSA